MANLLEVETCENCGIEGDGATAWGGWCHDCDNQEEEQELTWQEVKWQILMGIHNLREDK